MELGKIKPEYGNLDSERKYGIHSLEREILATK